MATVDPLFSTSMIQTSYLRAPSTGSQDTWYKSIHFRPVGAGSWSLGVPLHRAARSEHTWQFSFTLSWLHFRLQVHLASLMEAPLPSGTHCRWRTHRCRACRRCSRSFRHGPGGVHTGPPSRRQRRALRVRRALRRRLPLQRLRRAAGSRPGTGRRYIANSPEAEGGIRQGADARRHPRQRDKAAAHLPRRFSPGPSSVRLRENL